MEIFIIFALIILNGLFSLAEIAIVSARKTSLTQKAEAGDKKARAALKLASEPGIFLAGIQVGITLIGVLSGAFGETAIASKLSEVLAGVPAIGPYSKTVSTVIIVTGITYLTVVIGELVPKRIALHDPETIAVLVAGPMRRLARIAYPFVRLLSISSEIVLALIGSKPSSAPNISEEEIRILMKQGAEAGIFQKNERDFVSNIFRMDDVRIATIMTPRKDIVCWDLNDAFELNIGKVMNSPHNVLPVCEGGLEHPRGFLQAKDLLTDHGNKTADDLRLIMKPLLYVPESISPTKLFETFKSARTGIALVLDEYGSVEGLVTLYDVLESLVGEIPWLGSNPDPVVKTLEDGSWLIDGGYAVERLKTLFGYSSFPGEETGDFHTLAGFIMASLGRVPAESDSFEWNGFRFEVLDMDGNRIDKVRVSRIKKDL